MEVAARSKEMPADQQGDRAVDLIGVAFLFLTENNGGGNPFREVVHDAAGEHFPHDVQSSFSGGTPPMVFPSRTPPENHCFKRLSRIFLPVCQPFPP